jgi:6-phosphogluconolactonase
MIRHFESQSALAVTLAQSIADSLREAITARGTAYLCVSGGKTPAALFAELSRCDVPWASVHIRQADERLVHPGSADSNAQLQRGTLVQNKAASAGFAPFVMVELADNKSPVLSVTLDTLATDYIANDVLQLGMGDDGHFASLFPLSAIADAALRPDFAYAYVKLQPQNAPYERVSLSLPAVLKARRIVLQISGAAKLALLQAALRGDAGTRELPIAKLLAACGERLEVWWAA